MEIAVQNTAREARLETSRQQALSAVVELIYRHGLGQSLAYLLYVTSDLRRDIAQEVSQYLCEKHSSSESDVLLVLQKRNSLFHLQLTREALGYLQESVKIS